MKILLISFFTALAFSTAVWSQEYVYVTSEKIVELPECQEMLKYSYATKGNVNVVIDRQSSQLVIMPKELMSTFDPVHMRYQFLSSVPAVFEVEAVDRRVTHEGTLETSVQYDVWVRFMYEPYLEHGLANAFPLFMCDWNDKELKIIANSSYIQPYEIRQ